LFNILRITTHFILIFLFLEIIFVHLELSVLTIFTFTLKILPFYQFILTNKIHFSSTGGI